jgi:hypothetical protein
MSPADMTRIICALGGITVSLASLAAGTWLESIGQACPAWIGILGGAGIGVLGGLLQPAAVKPPNGTPPALVR